jgi:hypothetical protein
MGLKIVSKEDQACPVITCDWCNKEITDGVQATYAYVMGVGEYPHMIFPTESEVFYLHNGRCFGSFERHKEATDQIFLGTIPLQCLPIYLAGNMGVNWVKAFKTAQYMSGYNPELTPRLNRKDWGVLRKQILERDNYLCEYCGRRASEVDHVIPISRGGSNEPTNLVAACYDCNRGKRAKTVEEWVGI